MKPKKQKGQATTKDVPEQVEIPDEPYRYSLELVATIAARFVDGSKNDTAAADRAIAFLDAVRANIAGRKLMIRKRKEAERTAEGIPKQLKFAAGIRWITGKKTETEAAKAFREYLRLHCRLSDLGRPSQLTDEQVKELLQPLSDETARDVEESGIQKLTAKFQNRGFSQVDLGSAKEGFKRLHAGLVRPYMNSEKGKRGAAAKKAKKCLV